MEIGTESSFQSDKPKVSRGVFAIEFRGGEGKADSTPWRSNHTQNSSISCVFLAGGGCGRWMPCSCSVCFTVFTCLSCKDMLVSGGLGQGSPSRKYTSLRMRLLKVAMPRIKHGGGRYKAFPRESVARHKTRALPLMAATCCKMWPFLCKPSRLFKVHDSLVVCL